MERAMKNIAEFTIIGRVGARKTLGKAVRVTIASNYRLKDERGEWREDTHWNEVTVFSPTTQAYIAEHIAKGDLAAKIHRVAALPAQVAQFVDC